MALSKNLVQRTIFGALLVAAIISGIMWSPYSFRILTLVVCLGAVAEFSRLTTPGKHSILTYLAPLACALVLIMCADQIYCPSFISHANSLKFGVCTYTLLVMIHFICQLYNTHDNPINTIAHFTMGQFWIVAPCCMLYFLEFFNGFTPHITLAVFLAIWSNDTFAYCTGSLIGRHPMFPRISPKKTWEGFFGGAIGAVLIIWGYSIFTPETLSLPVWLGLAVVVVIFGTFGDLIESMLKRSLGVKDSGNVIPGHGGLLDRFDSMLLAVPASCVYLYLIHQII